MEGAKKGFKEGLIVEAMLAIVLSWWLGIAFLAATVFNGNVELVTNVAEGFFWAYLVQLVVFFPVIVISHIGEKGMDNDL